MPSEGFNFLVGGGIPQFHRVVRTASGQQLAIGAETDSTNRVWMPSEGFNFLVGGGIPQFHRVVRTASG